MTDRLRFTRQTRLPEVGEKGQERLSNATVRLATAGFAAEIETRYLQGAGVTVRPPSSRPRASSSASSPSSSIQLGLSDPAARECAEGALRALLAIRSILEAS